MEHREDVPFSDWNARGCAREIYVWWCIFGCGGAGGVAREIEHGKACFVVKNMSFACICVRVVKWLPNKHNARLEENMEHFSKLKGKFVINLYPRKYLQDLSYSLHFFTQQVQ